MVKLETFVIFIALVYVKHWVLSPVARDAQMMDLLFYQELMQLTQVESFETLAEGVLRKLRGHTWYLNQEFAPLSLFSSKVPDSTKTSLARKLVQMDKKKGRNHQYYMGYLTPVKLPDTLAEGMEVKLQNLVGLGSMMMFEVIGFDKSWLKKSPSTWSRHPGYQEMEMFVRGLMVCNDPAERNIKFLSDYAETLTKDPQKRQEILQVVEQNRQMCPTRNKSSIIASFQE